MERGRVSITFDDGLANIYSLALPELERFSLSGTVYVISDSIGQSYMGYPVMTKRMIQEMVSKGWEIGSHTRSHPQLTDMKDQEIRNELALSKNDLEAITNRKITSFAYPFGDLNNKVAKLAADYYANGRKVGRFPPLRMNSLTPRHRMKLNAMSACESAFTLPIHLYANFFPTANKKSVKGALAGLRSRQKNSQMEKGERGSGLNPVIVRKWVKKAVNDRSWLILCFHNVTSENTSTSYSISLKEFRKIVKEVATAPEVLTVGDAFDGHEFNEFNVVS